MPPAAVPAVVPARMLNEYAYCPRLAYLEWVQGEWEDNVETLEGSHVHRRVDRGPTERVYLHQRSVHLTSERLGVTAVIDLLERDGGRVRPIDYKRGKRPPVAGGAYEPERVQLCVQGLLLREHGHDCSEGLLYYAKSRDRVRVRFTKKLVARTEELLVALREDFGRGQIPPPLEDSPKCPRCSLVRICLPEEVRFLSGGGKVRPLAVADAGTHPLVVQEPGATVRLRGERLLVYSDGKPVASAPLGETSHVVLMGRAGCTSAALNACLQNDRPVVHMSGSGWLYGISSGLGHKNVELRAEQFAAARDEERALPVARALVAAKIRNARVLLRRNGKPRAAELAGLADLARRADEAGDAEILLGLEGSAGRLYYGRFVTMLKGPEAKLAAFDLERRNRRPPTDRLNALLSFLYTLLTKDWTLALATVGLDPLMGLYHQPRYGKPALALDMMEPFRPVVADSTAIAVVNNREVEAADFMETLGGVLLRPAARKVVVAAYQRRLAQKVRHPLFGYRVTYQRLFELEARLLARHLLGETAEYRPFEVR